MRSCTLSKRGEVEEVQTAVREYIVLSCMAPAPKRKLYATQSPPSTGHLTGGRGSAHGAKQLRCAGRAGRVLVGSRPVSSAYHCHSDQRGRRARIATSRRAVFRSRPASAAFYSTYKPRTWKPREIFYFCSGTAPGWNHRLFRVLLFYSFRGIRAVSLLRSVLSKQVPGCCHGHCHSGPLASEAGRYYVPSFRGACQRGLGGVYTVDLRRGGEFPRNPRMRK